MNSERHLIRDTGTTVSAHLPREALRIRLQYALAAGEFRLRYQPQWNALGQIQGAELQMEWQHPRYGLLPAEHVMAALMHSHLGTLLFEWLADRSVPLLQRLHQESIPAFGVSLALPFALASADTDAAIAPFTERLSRYALPPSAVTLVWQGSDDALSDAACLAGMHALQRQGYRSALAVYGEGYRQLAALPRLPVDTLYLPPGLISLVPHADATDLVRLIVRLAGKMALRCLALQVDSEQQFHRLSALGCTLFQGNYLFRPMEAHQLAVVCRMLGQADASDDP